MRGGGRRGADEAPAGDEALEANDPDAADAQGEPAEQEGSEGGEEAPPEPEAGDLVEPTEGQLEMNGRAIEAVNKNEFKTAIKLFQASIELGPLNITYLNMGRTYQRMGECVQAKETYRKARDTKYKVKNPDPVTVDKALNEYEAELYRTCPNGELVVSCDPAKLDLYINTRGPQSCPTEKNPMRLSEGEYVLRGTFPGYEDKEVAVTVQRVERAQAAISLPKKAKEKEPDKQAVQAGLNPNQQQPPPQNNKEPVQIVINTNDGKGQADQEPKSNAVAWVNLGLGTAVVLGALLWDTCFFQHGNLTDGNPGNDPGVGDLGMCQHTYNGAFDPADVGPTALYVVGGLLMLNGVFRF